MQDNTLDIADEFMKLVRQAIDAGFAQIQDDDQDKDILPALITDTAIIALGVQKLEDIFAVARHLLTSGNIKRGVLVYSGYLTLSGERTLAIFAEAFERGEEKVLRFAQVYRPATKSRFFKKGQPAERLGNLKFMAGSVEHRFS